MVGGRHEPFEELAAAQNQPGDRAEVVALPLAPEAIPNEVAANQNDDDNEAPQIVVRRE